MKTLSCELLLTGFPRISEFEELRSTYFPNSIFNYTAITLNIVSILAIRKTSSLPRTLKTLLLSLAVSDVGVGVVVQPFYTSLLIKWLKENNPGCNTHMVFNVITGMFALASFLGVVALSVDRFLAIHLHLRYQELVTHKRVIAVVIFIWVISIFRSSMALWASDRNLKPHFSHFWSCWSMCYNSGLPQGLFSCASPQESDSGPASTTSCTHSRNGKFC